MLIKKISVIGMRRSMFFAKFSISSFRQCVSHKKGNVAQCLLFLFQRIVSEQSIRIEKANVLVHFRPKTKGEGNDVTESMTAPWKETVLPTILSNYEPRNIFNADEFGLFYQALPKKLST